MMQEGSEDQDGRSDVRSKLVDPDAFVCRTVLFARTLKVSAVARSVRSRVGGWTHNKGEERVFFHLAARLEEDVQLLGRLDACKPPRIVDSNWQSASLYFGLPLRTSCPGSPCNFCPLSISFSSWSNGCEQGQRRRYQLPEAVIRGSRLPLSNPLAHLASLDEGLCTPTVPTAEARRDQIGDAGRLLHEGFGLGAGEELERKLGSSVGE